MSTQPIQSAQTNAPAEEEKRTSGKLDIANEAASLGFESGKSFLHLQRVAAMFAASNLVPDSFHGNVANCSIAVNLARRLGADELMVMQNLYVVYGRPGWSSKFKIAMFNQTGKFTPIVYEFLGQKGTDSYGCRAKCKNRETGDEIVGPDITIGLAKAEGWYDRKSKTGAPASKWPTMTDLMLRYRSAAWMIDTTAPELTMGLHTVEELVDTGELLDQAIKATEERMEAKRRAELAVAEAPSKLDALVDAGGGNGKPATAKGNGAPKTEEKPADAPKTAAKPADPSKPKGGAKASQQPAAPQGNPNYATGADPDPTLDGGNLFGGREPGSDDK